MNKLNLSAAMAVLALILTLNSATSEAVSCYKCLVPQGEQCEEDQVATCDKGDVCALLDIVTEDGNMTSRLCIFPTTCVQLLSNEQELFKDKVIDLLEDSDEDSSSSIDMESKLTNCEICETDKCNLKNYVKAPMKPKMRSAAPSADQEPESVSSASLTQISGLVMVASLAISLFKYE